MASGAPSQATDHTHKVIEKSELIIVKYMREEQLLQLEF